MYTTDDLQVNQILMNHKGDYIGWLTCPDGLIYFKILSDGSFTFGKWNTINGLASNILDQIRLGKINMIDPSEGMTEQQLKTAKQRSKESLDGIMQVRYKKGWSFVDHTNTRMIDKIANLFLYAKVADEIKTQVIDPDEVFS